VLAVCVAYLVLGALDGSLRGSQAVVMGLIILAFLFAIRKDLAAIVEHFKSRGKPKAVYLVGQLNDRIMLLERGTRYEDPLGVVLAKLGLGEVSGGGTMQSKEGEIEYIDIDIELKVPVDQALGPIKAKLEELGAPKGSKFIVESERNRQVPFGKTEGLAIYLNGTDLPAEVYQKCDSNIVMEEFKRLMGTEGEIHGSWQGPKETAFYMYGRSFDEMKSRLAGFVAEYPLCEKARVVQIA